LPKCKRRWDKAEGKIGETYGWEIEG